jgi:endonuclease/exonuclease/phosphatase family metal-dependent hydrolase
MSSRKSNVLLKAVSAQNVARAGQGKTPDMYCHTLEDFYEETKQHRRKLRRQTDKPTEILKDFVTNLKNARLTNGEASASAVTSSNKTILTPREVDACALTLRAMKHAIRKSQVAYGTGEKKEEELSNVKPEWSDMKVSETATEGSEQNLPIMKHAYPLSVSKNYVSALTCAEAMNVVDRGISLKGLRTIFNEYSKNEVRFEIFQKRVQEIGECIRCPGENLTHMLVKPETRVTECYIEFLYGVFLRKVEDAETAEKVDFIKKELVETLGTVNVFVSHTWQYQFQTLVEAVEQWEKNWEEVNGTKHETFYYFVDYFAVNQHDQKSDLDQLHEVVQKSKVTCLVLTPWEKPIPLLRCWCIYEIAKTELYPSTRLDVAFPPWEVKRFKKNFFDKDKVRMISRILESVDSEKADASYKPDKLKITKEISKLGGFQKVNELCIQNLRKWLIEQACEFADSEARGDYTKKCSNEKTFQRAFWVLKNVATFVRHQGKFEMSVKYLDDARKLMEEYYSVDAVGIDEKKEDVSKKPTKFEWSYSRITAGIEMKIIDKKKRIKQKDNYLKLLNSLANALTDDKQYGKAENIYWKTLQWRKELLTEDSKDTKITQFNLGESLAKQGKNVAAEEFQSKSYYSWPQDRDNKNVKDIKMTQFNLGVCLTKQGKNDAAEEILTTSYNSWPAKCKYRYWALFNLADIKSKTDRGAEAGKDFSNACKRLRTTCSVEERDRFLSLANVLWSKHLLRYANNCTDEEARKHLLRLADNCTDEEARKHLLRYAENCTGEEARTKILEAALEKAKFAYNNFRINTDIMHPDTRLAARAKRRLELKLNPGLKGKENHLRYELIQNAYERNWIKPLQGKDEGIGKNKIRVMQWNILADKLAYPDFKKGGFGCSFDLLDWTSCRKDKVCAEIIKYDPDILIVVELDHYEDIRLVLQEDFEYENIWKKKNKNFYTDGTGIFWKKNRFQFGKIYMEPLMNSKSTAEADQIFVAVELHPQVDAGEDFAPFVVCGAHLKSTKKSKGEVMRENQCKQIIAILKKEFPKFPVILAADLNAEAQCKDYKALAYPFLIDCGMISSYQSVLGKEPEFTSWKFRIDEDNSLSNNKDTGNVKEWKYTIDFIFHTKELNSVAVLGMPEKKEIDKAYGQSRYDKENDVEFARRRCLLPNERCPSDHLPILSEILLPPSTGWK